MAKQVASLFATLRLEDGQFTRGMARARDTLREGEASIMRMGGAARQVGGMMTAGLTVPLVGAGAAAVRMSTNFDESMANARSILGVTRAEAGALNDEILRLGATSRSGPQAVADAYYQIVSGVQDADAQMAILNQSIALSEAGNANLASTTTGLISVMNAYDMSASDAAFTSDVFTRTVQMGVGSMDQFVAALGPAAGLAFDLGISFEELAANTAFITKGGSSASEAVTQLTAVMSAFLKPNADMAAALESMGYANGQAAIEALGLQGAVQALYGTLGSTDLVAQALGTQEALGGAIALNTDRASAFNEEFLGGIEGATEAARAIQMESAAAQFDLLAASAAAVGISVGNALLPPLVDLAEKLTPVILALATTNPEVIQMAVGFLAATAAAGPLIMALGVLLSPAGLLIAAISGVLYYLNKHTDGGIIGAFGKATTAAQQLSFLGLYVLNRAATAAQQTVALLVHWMKEMWNWATKSRGALEAFNQTASHAQNLAGAVASGDTNRLIAASPLLGSLFGGARAAGGPVDSGKAYLVGEQGPELFVPSGSGSIMPNGAGMGAVNINMTVTEGNAREAGRSFAEGFEERYRSLYG